MHSRTQPQRPATHLTRAHNPLERPSTRILTQETIAALQPSAIPFRPPFFTKIIPYQQHQSSNNANVQLGRGKGLQGAVFLRTMSRLTLPRYKTTLLKLPRVTFVKSLVSLHPGVRHGPCVHGPYSSDSLDNGQGKKTWKKSVRRNPWTASMATQSSNAIDHSHKHPDLKTGIRARRSSRTLSRPSRKPHHHLFYSLWGLVGCEV